MIRIKIANKITIENPTPELKSACAKMLTIPNPLYYKLMRATGQRARAFYGTPQYFKYYKEKDGVLYIPRGCRGRLIKWLEVTGTEYSLEEEFVEIPIC